MNDNITAEWETDRSKRLEGGRFYLIRLRNIPADHAYKKGKEYVFEVKGRQGVKSVLARVDSLTAVYDYDKENGGTKVTGYYGIARPVRDQD